MALFESPRPSRSSTDFCLSVRLMFAESASAAFSAPSSPTSKVVHAVGGELLDQLEAVHVPLARLFEDVPGDLLRAVVVLGRRTDHLGGEVVTGLLERELLVGKAEVHGNLLRLRID